MFKHTLDKNNFFLDTLILYREYKQVVVQDKESRQELASLLTG